MCFSGWNRMSLLISHVGIPILSCEITLNYNYASTALAAAGESWVRRAGVNVSSVNSTEKPASPGNRPQLLTDPPPYQ